MNLAEPAGKGVLQLGSEDVNVLKQILGNF